MNISTEFLHFFISSGNQWVLYLLIFCSLLSVGIIIERSVYLSKIGGDFGQFISDLTKKLNSKESYDTIIAWCEGQKMLEANIAMVGLDKSKLGARNAEEFMNATLIAAKTRMEKGVIVLGTLGNNTPFIGLFGTIIGIIQAFHGLSTSQNQGGGQSEVVMNAIAEALVATAMGILVALPAVIAFNFINRTIKKKISNSNATAHIILTHLNHKETN